jgi:hypothetical protein
MGNQIHWWLYQTQTQQPHAKGIAVYFNTVSIFIY